MVVTEPDITLIKEKIIEILKSNESLWQEDNHEVGFTGIELGLPDSNQFMGLTYPICFVANDAQFETDVNISNPIGDELQTGKHTYQFRIIMFDQGATGQEVERQLDGIYKIAKETLKGKFRLEGVEGVIESYPLRGHSFNFGENDGKPIDGRVIILKVVAT